jgi:hypothetical protein
MSKEESAEKAEAVVFVDCSGKKNDESRFVSGPDGQLSWLVELS